VCLSHEEEVLLRKLAFIPPSPYIGSGNLLARYRDLAEPVEYHGKVWLAFSWARIVHAVHLFREDEPLKDVPVALEEIIVPANDLFTMLISPSDKGWQFAIIDYPTFRSLERCENTIDTAD
jgi:hypothetical protein